MDNAKKVSFGIMAAALTAAGLSVDQAAATVMVATTGLIKYMLVKPKDKYYSYQKYWVQDVGYGYCVQVRELTPTRRYIDTYEVLDTVWARDPSELNWKLTHYYVEDGDAGWLSPEGIMWTCLYEGHSDLAHYVLDMRYSELEAAGWVHVDGCGGPYIKSYRMVTYQDSSTTPTSAQLKWLSENGHDIAYHGHGEAAKSVKTIEVNGYKLDAVAEEEAFKKYMALAPKR